MFGGEEGVVRGDLSRGTARWATTLGGASDSDVHGGEQRRPPSNLTGLAGHVLLVEDDPGDRLVMRHMLESIGVASHDIVTVETSSQALAEALAAPPAYVVCDWLLEDDTAQGFLRDLHSACPGAATVVVTADVTTTREALALEAGAQEVLSKAETSPALLMRALRTSRERVDAEQRNRHLETRVSGANRLESMGTLAAGVVHDLNNLLQGVMTNLELVASDVEPSGSSMAAVDEAHLALRRAASLCRQLMSYGRTGKRKLEAFDARDLAEASLLVLSRRNRAKISLVDHGHELPRVWADPSALQQVIYNLVLNGLDAVDEQGMVHVELRPCKPGDYTDTVSVVPPPEGRREFVCFSVRDEGPGIPSDKLKEVFMPFVSTKPGSRGLGLPSVVRAVQDIGGALSVRTNSAGTEFLVGIPIQSQAEAASTRTDLAAINPEMRTGPVVVMDRRCPSPVVEHLRDEGYEVEWCRSPSGVRHLVDDLRGRAAVVVVCAAAQDGRTGETATKLSAQYDGLPVVFYDEEGGIMLGSESASPSSKLVAAGLPGLDDMLRKITAPPTDALH